MACTKGIQHTDGLVPSYDPEADLAAGTQLYQLIYAYADAMTGEWNFLLKRCGCPGAPEPPAIYEPLTPEQARQWM